MKDFLFHAMRGDIFILIFFIYDFCYSFVFLLAYEFEMSGIAIFGIGNNFFFVLIPFISSHPKAGRMLLSDLFPEEEVESAICALISAAVEEDQRKNEGKMCYQMVQTTLKKVVISYFLSLSFESVLLYTFSLLFSFFFLESMGLIINFN